MLSLEALHAIISLVRYKNWNFIVGARGDEFFLQVKFFAPDIGDPTKLVEQSGRKWWISRYMTKSEVVQTAFLACLKAEEHECREQFHYREQTIFCPHFSVDELADFSQQTTRDKRK